MKLVETALHTKLSLDALHTTNLASSTKTKTSNPFHKLRSGSSNVRVSTGVLPRCQDAILQAFADILATNEVFDAPMDETYRILGMDPKSTNTLEAYLKEYFASILKKLKEVLTRI